MKIAAALLALVLALSGCAEIDKPITPDDPWQERGTRQSNSLPF